MPCLFLNAQESHYVISSAHVHSYLVSTRATRAKVSSELNKLLVITAGSFGKISAVLEQIIVNTILK